MDEVIAQVRKYLPEARFCWWETGRVRRIDLLAIAGEVRIGFCFCLAPLLRNKDWLPLAIARRRGVIQRGFILYGGARAFIVSQATYALPLAAFLMETGEWLHRQPEAQVLKEIRRRAAPFQPSVSDPTCTREGCGCGRDAAAS